MSNYASGSSEVIAISDYVSTMFGAPVINVELDPKNYTNAFNTAVEEYSNYITQWAIKSNISNALGLDGATDFTQRWVSQNFDFANSYARAYAEQANAGGTTPIYKNYFVLEAGKQEYCLPDDILLNEIMWQEPPAITRYLVDPNNNPAWVNFEFGWGYMGQSYMYIVPAYFSIQLAQATDMRWKIWRGDYTHTVRPAGEDPTRTDYTGRTRNCVTIYPTPKENQGGVRVWYFYRNASEANQWINQTAGQYVNNPATMRMDEIPYSSFNSSSQRWVKQYSYALCKEMLGNIRSKFNQLPIPDATITMDGELLRSEGIEYQNKLKDYLREELENIDTLKMLEDGASKAESINKTLWYNPMKIHIG